MKKLFSGIFEWLARSLKEEKEATTNEEPKIPVQIILNEEDCKIVCQSQPPQEIKCESLTKTEERCSVSFVIEPEKSYKKPDKKKEMARGKKYQKGDLIPFDHKDVRDIRDVMALMEIPFVALSKKRTEPIIYESPDGRSKVRISCHAPNYVASIYDWDIILFVSSKLQEIINAKLDIPPRTLIITRHELLKAINKHDGKKEEKDIRASLARLKLTGIETTIHNEDGRYDAGFGFLDSWGYTDRKDVKEFRITLSEWLYEITCHDGSLLKIHPEYFKITSGFKRFLYRTARKHVGTQNESWSFSIERLYEKSGSEQEFKKFKYKLKKAVKDNDIPSYMLEWKEEDGQTSVLFINGRKKLKEMLTQKTLPDSAPLHTTN